MINKLNKQGGKRKGSGRKPAPYKTKTISFRVREEWIAVIKQTVQRKIQELNPS
jgi:hypothetical protein